MYSDFLFNINQIIEENGLEETSNILSRFAGNRPFFALDSGITCNDIWERSKKILQCIEAIEDACRLAIEALEKQIPKKPIMVKDTAETYYICSECEWEVDKFDDNYCSDCGQKLDWSSKE